MLRELTNRLLLSAQGRNLAVEIADRYGDQSLETVDASLARDDVGDVERQVLVVARREILNLMPRLHDRGPKC